jgi:nucleotide-binding universal stress UspA family protein
MQAGRPVLVYPYAGKFDAAPKHVLISWNASREATRAVTDAIPFLRAAQKVTVLAINPKTSAEGHGDIPAADIALYLSRHGVKAEAMADPAVQIDIGNYLLSRAADLSVDMIVMGAYGHARMRELVFGGVTQTIMREMTVPVLLSH